MRTAFLFVVATILFCAMVARSGNAAELLMVGRSSCPYCKAWEIEVGSVYAKTAESRVAPLRRVEIDDMSNVSHYRFKEPVIYTPTFILLVGDVEIGRIVGYSNEAMFWGLLGALLDKVEPEASKPMRTSRQAEPKV